MTEFAIVLIMFSPVIAGLGVVVGCVIGDISWRKKKKKQDEQLNYLLEKMGKAKYIAFLKEAKECYDPGRLIEITYNEYLQKSN